MFFDYLGNLQNNQNTPRTGYATQGLKQNQWSMPAYNQNAGTYQYNYMARPYVMQAPMQMPYYSPAPQRPYLTPELFNIPWKQMPVRPGGVR